MKKTKITALLLVLVLVASLLAGCGSTPAATPSPTAKASTEVKIKDMMDREVILSAPATKVVALTAADCEIIYAIGAESTLVGRGEYCDYPEDVKKLPSLQSGKDTNIEQIIALKPQVVIMNVVAQTNDQIKALESAGIKVVASKATTIEGAYTAITMIGAVVGKNEAASKLISDMKASFSELKAKVKESSGKKIYFEVMPLKSGLYSAGKGTFMDEIATMLGLTNIFADVTGWAKVSEDQVLTRNPDYILTISMGKGQDSDLAAEIVSRAAWKDISAVKNGKVLHVDSNLLSRPGPRLTDAAKAIYNFVYGK